jgi:hypothetical protein
MLGVMRIPSRLGVIAKKKDYRFNISSRKLSSGHLALCERVTAHSECDRKYHGCSKLKSISVYASTGPFDSCRHWNKNVLWEKLYFVSVIHFAVC